MGFRDLLGEVRGGAFRDVDVVERLLEDDEDRVD